MRNIVKALFMALMVAVFAAGCEQPVEETPVKVRLNKELISNLPVGSSQTLVATLEPKDAVATVVWSSSDDKVVVVNEDGVVTGVAPGEAVITAAVEKETATCKVIVTAIKPTKIEFDQPSARVERGTTLALELVFTPSNAVASDLTWESSNTKVASVADGVVTALAVGKTTITATCNGGELAAVCQIEVVEAGGLDKVPVTQIQIPSSLKLYEGEEVTLTVVVLPEDATDKSVSFSSNNTDCVTVDPQTGVVMAVKAGSATVTAKANDGSGKSAVCAVIVQSKDASGVELDSITLSAEGNASDLQAGLTLQLSTTCIPTDYKPNSISWYISKNEELATVDQNGLVTAVKAVKETEKEWSKVTVTANADGVEGTYSIRIIPKQPESIEIDLPEDGWIKVGQQWNFNPRVLPEGLGFGVTCSIMKPGNNFTADPVVSSEIPGILDATFAVATHENLVYESYRRNANITILPYWVETISLPVAQEMEVGGSIILTPEFTSDVEGYQPTYKDVKWKSSDPSVATIDERTGEITAIADGVTNITVTTTSGWAVPSGQEQKSATCVLTVKTPETSLNVGDYFYSDGTWSAELQSDKTVVGVVFAKANAVASDPEIAKDFPGCTHGLVLGLVEYAQQDFGSVSYSNGHNYYTGIGYDASSIVNPDKPNGYGNSKAHRELNAAKPDYVSMFNEQSGVIAEQTNAVVTPSGASSWYVPSYREMTMILANYDAINESLTAAGGTEIASPYENEDSWDDKRSSDWYWTSTIYGVQQGQSFNHFKYAFDISKGSWTTSQQSFAKCKVRVVFAF